MFLENFFFNEIENIFEYINKKRKNFFSCAPITY